MDSEWSRAYPTSPGRWGVIVWEAGGLGYLQWTTVHLFDITGSASWVLAAAFAILWIIGSRRIVQMGLYLSESALMIRGIVRTRTIAWTSIEWLSIVTIVLGVMCVLGPTGVAVWFATPVWLVVTAVDLLRRISSLRSGSTTSQARPTPDQGVSP